MKRLLVLLMVTLLLATGCSKVETFNEITGEAILDEPVEEIEEQDQLIERSAIDLSVWEEEDIIDALGNIDADFKEAKRFLYEYNEGAYYDINGAFFKKDPFSKLMYRDHDLETDVGHLRIFDLRTGQDTFEDYYQRIVVKQDQLDNELECTKYPLCRGLEYTQCIKDGQDAYIWSEGNFLFVTRDDREKTINAFKGFYC